MDPYSFDTHICPQFMLGGAFSSYNQLFGGTPEPRSKESEEEGYGSESYGSSSHQPIKRRFFLFTFPLGNLISVWCWDNINNQRFFVGSTQVFCGFILCLFSSALFLLVGFQGSWGWFL